MIEYRTHGGLRLAIFDPSDLGVVISPTTDPNKAVPMRGAEAMSRSSGAALVANGPMFDNCAGQTLPYGNASYAQSRCSVLRGALRDTRRNVNAPGVGPTGIMLSISGDRAYATMCSAGRCATNGQTCPIPPGASVAIQLCPPLIVDGRVVASISVDMDTVQRAGLFIMEDGRMALGLMASSMYGFASAARAAGAVAGGYTDGGGSARWVASDGTVHGAGEDRPVGSWLAVGGGKGWLGLATVAVLVGGAVWWIRRRR